MVSAQRLAWVARLQLVPLLRQSTFLRGGLHVPKKRANDENDRLSPGSLPSLCGMRANSRGAATAVKTKRSAVAEGGVGVQVIRYEDTRKS
jgi:hypothetical protein